MRQVGLQRVAEHVDVGVVRGDDQRVDHARGEHIAVVGEVLHLRESAPSMLRKSSDQLSEVCTGSQTAVTEAPSSR